MTFLGRKSGDNGAKTLINYFYVIGHEIYRIRRNKAQ